MTGPATREIALRGGNTTLVDAEDYPFLSQWRWHERKGYVMRDMYDRTTGKYRRIFMHRLILGTPEGQYTDHVNGNRLDNRRSNLRVCTARQNQRNRHATKRNGARSQSQFKGVSFHRRDNLWRARIKVEGKHLSLGYFKDEEQAARAYDAAAQIHFQDFAVLNFPNA